MATQNGTFKCKRKLDDGNVYAYLKRLKMSKGNTIRFAQLLKDNHYNFDIMKGKKAGQLVFSIDVTDESQNKKELKKLIHALKSSLNKKQINHIDETVVKSKSSEIVNELINCYEKKETIDHAGDGKDIGGEETDRGAGQEPGNSNSDDSSDNPSDKSALDKLNKTHVEQYITEKEKKKEMRRLEKERKKEEKERKKEEKKREKEEIKRIKSKRNSGDKENIGSKSEQIVQRPASETNDLCYEELKKLYEDLKNKMEYIENNIDHGNKQTNTKQSADTSGDPLDDSTEPRCICPWKPSHKHSKRHKNVERIEDDSREDIINDSIQPNKNETNRNQRKTEGKVSFEDMKNRKKKTTNRKRAPRNQSSSIDTSSRSSSKGKDKRNRSPRKTKIKTKKVQSSKEIKKPSRRREKRKTLRVSYALRNESKLKTLTLLNRSKSRKLSTYVPHRSTIRNNSTSNTAKYGQNKSFQIKRDKTLGIPGITKQQQSNHHSNLPPKLVNHSKLPSNHCNIPPKYNNHSVLQPKSRNDSKLPPKSKSNESKVSPGNASDYSQLPVRNSTETTSDREYKDKTLKTKYSSERIACSESLQTFISKLL